MNKARSPNWRVAKSASVLRKLRTDVSASTVFRYWWKEPIATNTPSWDVPWAKNWWNWTSNWWSCTISTWCVTRIIRLTLTGISFATATDCTWLMRQISNPTEWDMGLLLLPKTLPGWPHTWTAPTGCTNVPRIIPLSSSGRWEMKPATESTSSVPTTGWNR